MSALLKLEDLSFSYLYNQQVNLILNKIDFSLACGEYVAVMGPSGSGKSTLANVIGLLISNFEGQFQFNGVDLSINKDPTVFNKLRSDFLSFIFQDYNLLNHLTALENVLLPLTYSSIQDEQQIEMAHSLFSQLHILDKINFRPGALSGGQKQRVAIARALIKKPLLIIADEPTGALDKQSRADVLGILQTISSAGTAIVMVTHSDEDAQAADRVIKIDDGQIVSDQSQTNKKSFQKNSFATV